MSKNEDEKEMQETTSAETQVASEPLPVDGEATPPSEGTPAEDPTAVLKDQLLRTMADFENFKKRKQREFADLIQNANERLILDILPVIDDYERALKVSKDIKTEDAAVQQAFQGFDFIFRKLMKALETKGLKPMESVGQPFNVELHDALLQIEDPSRESHTVVDEHERGYYLNDKVIRHAKVIVTK